MAKDLPGSSLAQSSGPVPEAGLMVKLDNLKLATKIVIVLFGALAGTLLIFAGALYVLDDELHAGRRLTVQTSTETAFSLVAGYEAAAKAGRISENEAKRAAIDAVRTLRYGDGGYFWINDMAPTMVMHPIQPDLDGKSLSSMTTPSGAHLFLDMVELVKSHGGGFYAYRWPKPGSDSPVRKLSYIKGFAPWGWIIGTGVYLDDIEALFIRKAITGAAVFLALLAAAAAVSRVILGRITRPLINLTEAMDGFAAGNFSYPITGADRRDEIGNMSRSVQTFQRHMHEIETLRQERDEDQTLQKRRAATIEKATQSFEGGIATVLQDLVSSVGQLEGIAGTLSQGARTADSRAAAVTEAAQAMLGDMQTVKEAASYMVDVVSEAAAAAGESNKMVDEAAAETAEAGQNVDALKTASSRIAEAVTMISTIAAQTNLLALNATIEAARAGDAGKGFAVVAGEVKTLASQTSKANEEIGRQAEAICQATEGMVSSIGRIEAVVGRLRVAVDAIASASEAQHAATREIDQRAQQVIDFSSKVTADIAVVHETVLESGGGAEHVHRAAKQLVGQADGIRRQVAGFIAEVTS